MNNHTKLREIIIHLSVELSHEFQVSVNGILGLLQLLINEGPSINSKEYYNLMAQSAIYINALLELLSESIVRFSDLEDLPEIHDFIIKRLRSSEMIEAGKREKEKFLKFGKPAILRELKFQPEYAQAGVALMSYFGKILRDKYPDKHVDIKILQPNSDTVRFEIYTSDGESEVIERLLSEYAKVLLGEVDPREITETKEQLFELKLQLKTTQHQLEMIREFNSYLKEDNSDLRKQLGRMLLLVERTVWTPDSVLALVNRVHVEIDSSPALSSQQKENLRTLLGELRIATTKELRMQLCKSIHSLVGSAVSNLPYLAEMLKTAVF